jgi:hypothetical protein
VSDIEIPADPETERLLLGALLLMLPQDRDAAVSQVSSVWFSDPWPQRFFNVQAANRRRDFTQEHIDGSKFQPTDNAAWWISQLLCDRDGESVAGRPQLWKEYSHVIERVYRARLAILCKLEELNDAINSARSQTYAICDDSIRDAKTNGRSEGPRTGNLRDRVAEHR